MGGGLGRVTKHPEYYLSDGSVSFLTRNVLFNVHRSYFERESEVFRDLFARAAEDDPQSGTDARPFTLDVDPDEFAQFLWVWYDKEYSYHKQTKENWVTILRLSTRWAFPKIRELAIWQLEAMNLSPAERISIYNEHGIDDDRLLSSYVELCRSPTVPTEADSRLLNMGTLINILQAREDAQRRAVELGHQSPTSASLEEDTFREIVLRFFSSSLSPRSNGIPTGSEAQASNLNGEHTQGTSSHGTITLRDPQIPDGKSTKTTEDKEREEKEKAVKAKAEKEREEKKTEKEKEKAEKARLAKEKEERERERSDKAKEEKEAKEKNQKTEQKLQQNPRRK